MRRAGFAARRARGALAGLGLAVLSVAVLLLGLEVGVRALQWVGAVRTFRGRELLEEGDAMMRWNAHMVPSRDPLLVYEFDPNDPLINSHGARGAEFAVEKAAGVKRIAVLGDSVTFGLGVPTEDTFSYRLERLLNEPGSGGGSTRWEVLNFGVNGYGTPEELELYKVRVAQFRPDLVLVAYVLNDPYSPEWMTAIVGVAMREAARVDGVGGWSQLAAWTLLKWNRVRKRFDSERGYEKAYGDPRGWSRVTEPMREFARIHRETDVPVGVVIFPLLVDLEHYCCAVYHEKVHALLRELGLPYLDLTDAYREVGVAAVKIRDNDDTHPNAVGHAIAAQKIYDWVKMLGS